ncbi:OmpA family protein [Quatrionicoccus australiensis]|uniref:OmpA family protein n=1 Tax=Quatrionicoccus australiensis TaxID=138118 RepID=UPI001CFB313F|nr:OmpA family protein [Quatrionicoccus australiensis]MCB4358913.1 OmpA family protein [Quatrionicoccus australiensis]
MIKNIAKKSLVVALLAGIGFSAVAQERVYAIDQRDTVVKSGFGLCWRDGYWTPAAAAKDKAGCECDKDLLPAEACAAPAAKGAAAAPAVAGVKPSGEKITVAADALFDFNKAVLRPEGKAKLDDVVAKSKAIKLEVILAVGHTDRIGGDAYNQKLSEKRAAAVKEYLVAKGIEANRVYTEGKGEKQPVTGDKCKGNAKTKALIDCLQPDRRVDIEVIGTK